jgi:hypothetical protein
VLALRIETVRGEGRRQNKFSLTDRSTLREKVVGCKKRF